MTRPMSFQDDTGAGRGATEKPADDEARAPQAQQRHPGRTKSMHEGVPDWYDCCSCEMEPYWREATQEGDAAGDEDARSRERDRPAKD